MSFVSHKKHLLNNLASCLVWAYIQHHLCSHTFQMVGIYSLFSLFVNRRHPEVTPEVSTNTVWMRAVTLAFLKMSTQWLHFLHGHISPKCPTELAACSSLPMTPPTWTQAVISLLPANVLREGEPQPRAADSQAFHKEQPFPPEAKLSTSWNRVASTSPEMSGSGPQENQPHQVEAWVTSG